MLQRQIDQLLLKDTFHLFDFSTSVSPSDVLKTIKEKFNSSQYDTLLFYECLRMKNYASVIFENKSDEVEVDQNDEIVDEYIGSINKFVEDCEDSEVKKLFEYRTK